MWNQTRGGLRPARRWPILLNGFTRKGVLQLRTVGPNCAVDVLHPRAACRRGRTAAAQAVDAVVGAEPYQVPRLLSAHVRADIAWAHEYLGRLRSGAYAFDGEPPLWTPTPEQVETARLAGVGPGVLLVEAQGHGLPGTRNSQG